MDIQLDIFSFWMLGAVLLVLFELLTGAFVFLFIALGFCVAGFFSFFHSFRDEWSFQLLICSITSVVGIFFLRRPLWQKLLRAKPFHSDIGKEIQIDQTMHFHEVARISYQGSEWFIKSLDLEPLIKGDRALIVGVEGNTFLVKKTHQEESSKCRL